jgi:hypothetical protein
MIIKNRKSRLTRIMIGMLAIFAALIALLLNLEYLTIDVSARAADVFGPACGSAVMDGIVNPQEWSGASMQTFQMVKSGAGDPFTATLHVMNNWAALYLGITINDDEFSPIGTWLPQGDGFRIDFDNDHSGSLFTVGDNVLNINAGSPQFDDGYIYIANSAQSDVNGGGTLNGTGAASRLGDLNHFELRFPLCSGDALDFCLHPGDSVGFRLEYLDAQANGDFGGSQLFPGREDTSEAVIVIGQCPISGALLHLPLIIK